MLLAGGSERKLLGPACLVMFSRAGYEREAIQKNGYRPKRQGRMGVQPTLKGLKGLKRNEH